MLDAAHFVNRFFAARDADLLPQKEFATIDENLLDYGKDESVALLALRDRCVENAADGNVFDIVFVLKEAGVAELIGLENFG